MSPPSKVTTSIILSKNSFLVSFPLRISLYILPSFISYLISLCIKSISVNANGYHIGMINKCFLYIHENVEPILSLVPRSKCSGIAKVVETSNADTTPIQRQISCNIQNDNKNVRKC